MRKPVYTLNPRKLLTRLSGVDRIGEEDNAVEACLNMRQTSNRSLRVSRVGSYVCLATWCSVTLSVNLRPLLS